MAAVVSQTNNRPATPQTRRRAGEGRTKYAKELAEIDVKKKNAWIIERMVKIHRVGGFQRRYGIAAVENCRGYVFAVGTL